MFAGAAAAVACDAGLVERRAGVFSGLAGSVATSSCSVDVPLSTVLCCFRSPAAAKHKHVQAHHYFTIELDSTR